MARRRKLKTLIARHVTIEFRYDPFEHGVPSEHNLKVALVEALNASDMAGDYGPIEVKTRALRVPAETEG